MNWNILSGYILTAALSGLKFIFGPITGYSIGLSLFETSLCTALGMITTVWLISIAGRKIHNFFIPKNRKLFTSRNRMIIRIWRRYGIWGVAFFTPLILTPIGGTIIAVSLGERYTKILPYMSVSAFFWAFIFSYAVYQLGGNLNKILELLPF
ncbi:MAG: hypothetical protein NZM38_00695 [Cytophagales bacterium]|nr:hypothetical protein [Cytophagales bacterium]MDW8383265.1 hypothetical protein [Flammeovirgaceae bacterium]